MQVELNEVGKKLVVGLRQVAADLIGRGDREEHGFDLEAMPQYADRISGYATELAHAIGYVEASPDLLAARELAAKVFERYASRPVRVAPVLSYTSGAGAAMAIREGALDDIDVVQDLLAAVERGRELAAEAHQRQRIRDMLSAPTPTVPDRLTITIEGPRDGCSRWGSYLGRVAMSETIDNPLIVEMREGRRFDVRGEVFLDSTTEAVRG